MPLIPLKTGPTTIKQYVQAHVGGSNNMKEEQTMDGLYIDSVDNRSGHIVFKLRTNEAVSVNRVAEISMSQEFIDIVSVMVTEYGNQDGIEFSIYHENITVLDLLTYYGDYDSNASNKSFKFDNLYQKEFKR